MLGDVVSISLRKRSAPMTATRTRRRRWRSTRRGDARMIPSIVACERRSNRLEVALGCLVVASGGRTPAGRYRPSGIPTQCGTDSDKRTAAAVGILQAPMKAVKLLILINEGKQRCRQQLPTLAAAISSDDTRTRVAHQRGLVRALSHTAGARCRRHGHRIPRGRPAVTQPPDLRDELAGGTTSADGQGGDVVSAVITRRGAAIGYSSPTSCRAGDGRPTPPTPHPSRYRAGSYRIASTPVARSTSIACTKTPSRP